MALRTRLKSKTKMSVPKNFCDQSYLYQLISEPANTIFDQNPLECFADICNKGLNKHASPSKEKFRRYNQFSFANNNNASNKTKLDITYK